MTQAPVRTQQGQDPRSYQRGLAGQNAAVSLPPVTPGFPEAPAPLPPYQPTPLEQALGEAFGRLYLLDDGQARADRAKAAIVEEMKTQYIMQRDTALKAMGARPNPSEAQRLRWMSNTAGDPVTGLGPDGKQVGMTAAMWDELKQRFPVRYQELRADYVNLLAKLRDGTLRP